MCRLPLKVSELTLLMLLIVPSFSLPGEGLDFAGQQTDIKTASRTKDDAVKKSELMRPHFEKGNQVMQDAKAIRQQLQTATSDQKTTLLARMKEDYQTAITEYEQALEDTEVRDENGLQVIGKIGVIRNGLVSQQKAVEMLVQDKDLPVILSNLGMAYDGVGQYQDAINTLEQAALLNPAVGTYMELGTDLAQVGKTPEAIAACDKTLTVDPTAQNMQAGCYKNVAIVLTNKGKLLDAIAPLQKVTLLNPQDALAWKLLGDSLLSTMTSKSQDGKIVYVIPPGTVEAYQRYLQLDPNGPYAGQIKSALEGLAQFTKSPTEKKDKN
ncbi:MAG TPA: tetratricopeptide repeat protein [Candidatus Sulfotelmatobacter sp.]|nr:tetratricopeptide repeat protein [Candidatus Sulfotelmatobacter sp.]